MKKLLFIFVTVLLPMVANADAVEINGIYYTFNKGNKTAEVTINPNDYSGHIAIPESVTYNNEEYIIRTIGREAFAYCPNLISVNISNSVTRIEPWAFAFSNIVSVTLPNSINYIGESTFIYCKKLKEIRIPDSVKEIANGTFQGCISLDNVIFPHNLIEIGSYAFDGCENITFLDLPNSTRDIKTSAFSFCKKLSHITFPKYIKNVGAQAFWNCESLEAVYISDINSWFDISFEGSDANPLNNAHHLYLNDEEIKDLIIPDGIIEIGDFLFTGCTSLVSIVFNERLSKIGVRAFWECTGIKSLIFNDKLTSIGEGAFWGCSSLASVRIGKNVNTIGKIAFGYCPLLSNVYITNLLSWCNIHFDGIYLSEGAFGYPHHLFLNDEEIKDLIIPDEINSINNYTFSYCEGLSSLSIHNNVEKIGFGAFYGCTSLNSIKFGSGIVTIDASAFEGCIGLTSINLPINLTKIDNNAFNKCTGLTSISFPNSLSSIGFAAFCYCENLTSICLPSSLIRIDDAAFFETPALTDVYCYITDLSNEIKANCFDSKYTKWATLHVPSDCIIKYKKNAPWYNFKDIVALTDNDPKPSAIKKINFPKDNSIIYDLMGRNNTSLLKGVYIKNGKKIIKK